MTQNPKARKDSYIPLCNGEKQNKKACTQTKNTKSKVKKRQMTEKIFETYITHNGMIIIKS